MRVPIYAVAVTILAAAAFAQDSAPVQPKQPPENAAPSTADKSNQGQTGAQTSGAPSGQAPGSTQGTSEKVKTQTYSGTLMDAACAGSGSAATASTSSTSSPAASTASSADRSAGSGSNQSCGVSANTTQFAMKMKDGNTVQFDEIGNARAQEAMKTRKKWSDLASANKPIQLKASGVLNGDKLTVLSVN
jgi:hypothetical protein